MVGFFENINLDPMKVIINAKNLVAGFFLAETANAVNSCFQPPPFSYNNTWTPLKPNVLKINYDVIFNPNTLQAFSSMMTRNPQGNLSVGHSSFFQ